MDSNSFAPIWKSISDFLYEEEANIDRKKIISVGTMLALAAILMGSDALAAHGSHRSSHSSHSSSSHGNGHNNHYSHQSHVSSHSSHVSSSHSSHGSSTHSNHASHSSEPAHVNHSSLPDHSAHSSHSSGSTSHTSHASASSVNTPTHSNSGVSNTVPDNTGTTTPDVTPEGVIDIRTPLTPPDSPLMNGEGGN